MMGWWWPNNATKKGIYRALKKPGLMASVTLDVSPIQRYFPREKAFQ
jgi:hypothetical protein